MINWAIDTRVDYRLRRLSAISLILLMSFSMVSFANGESLYENFIGSESMNIIENNDQKNNSENPKPKIFTSYKLSLSENLNMKSNDRSKNSDTTKLQSQLTTNKKVLINEKLAIITSDPNNTAILLTIKNSSDRHAIIERIIYNDRPREQKSTHNAYFDDKVTDHQSPEIYLNDESTSLTQYQDQIQLHRLDNIQNMFLDDYGDEFSYVPIISDVSFDLESSLEIILRSSNDLAFDLVDTVDTLVDTKNPTFLIYLVPIVGFVLIRSEKPSTKFYQLQRFLGLVFVIILISSAVTTPLAVSSSYWGMAFGQETQNENATSNDITSESTDDIELANDTVDEPIEEEQNFTSSENITNETIENHTIPDTSLPIVNEIEVISIANYTDDIINENITEPELNATEIASNFTNFENSTINQPSLNSTLSNSTSPISNSIVIYENYTSFDLNITESFVNNTNSTDFQLNITESFVNSTNNTSTINNSTNSTALLNNTTTFTNQTVISSNVTENITNSTDLSTNATSIPVNTTEIIINATEISANLTDDSSELVIPNSTKSWEFDTNVNGSNFIGNVLINQQGINKASLEFAGDGYFSEDVNFTRSISNVTVTAWVKPNYIRASTELTVISNERSFALSINNIIDPRHVAKFEIFDGIKWHTVEGTQRIGENWSHLAATFNGTTLALYSNGTLDSIKNIKKHDIQSKTNESTSKDSSKNSEITIGAAVSNVRMVDDSEKSFSGLVDDVKIFDIALSAKQIYEIYIKSLPFIIENIEEPISESDNVEVEPVDILKSRVSNQTENETLPVNASTNLILNTTENYLKTTNEELNKEIKTVTISSWIRPDYTNGSPEFTILGKEKAFILSINNLIEPRHVAKFSVFDGITWTTITGAKTIDQQSLTHLAAVINGTQLRLYINGTLEGTAILPQPYSVSNGKLTLTTPTVMQTDSDLVIGAYVSTKNNYAKLSNYFSGTIEELLIYKKALTQVQVQEIFESNIIIADPIISSLEPLVLSQHLFISDSISLYVNKLPLNEIYETSDRSISSFSDSLSFVDNITIYFNNSTIKRLSESIFLNVTLQTHSEIPIKPEINPRLDSIKDGYMLDEAPEFTFNYYQDSDMTELTLGEYEKIQTSISQAIADLESLDQLLSNKNTDYVELQMINNPTVSHFIFGTLVTAANLDSENSISQAKLESIRQKVKENLEAIKQILPEVNSALKTVEQSPISEDEVKQLKQALKTLKQARKQLQESGQALNKLGNQLIKLGDEFKEEGETTKQIGDQLKALKADIKSTIKSVQKNKWQGHDEELTIELYDSQGNRAILESEFEQVFEGKLDIRLESNRSIKPGVYTIIATLVKGGETYVSEQEFVWGLVSLNTKKSIYKPGDTISFEIVVLDSLGSPVCDANLNMNIQDPNNHKIILSSPNEITPNVECGLYDASYTAQLEGNHTVTITARARGIDATFSTNFLVQKNYDYDIIRTTLSKIDPITNPNSFDVTIDIESFTGDNSITIKEYVPNVFEIVTDGSVQTIGDTKIITWQKTLDSNKATVQYQYSVPLIFPSLYALGKVTIEHENTPVFTEARNWYVAVDPVVKIDPSITSTIDRYQDTAPNVVFVNQTHGAIFYIDSSNQLYFKTTSNGGTTWTGKTLMESVTHHGVAVWYDHWTPGDNTVDPKIHVLTFSASDKMRYSQFDIDGPIFSSFVDTSTGTQGSLNPVNTIFISKATNGDLYAVTVDTSAPSATFMERCPAANDCTIATSWINTANPWDTGGVNRGDDALVLLPIDDGTDDMMLIVHDITANNVIAKRWYNATASWDTNWTTVDPDLIDSTAYDGGFGGAAHPLTGDLYICGVHRPGTVNTSEIRMNLYNITLQSWSTVTKPFDASTDTVSTLVDCSVGFDKLRGDIYVSYIRDPTDDNNQNNRNAYFKSSDDNAISWSAETILTDDPIVGTGDYRGVTINIADSRIYSAWFEQTNVSLFGNTVIIPAPPPPEGTIQLFESFTISDDTEPILLSDFKIQRGYTVIPNGQLSAIITAGVDYTAPANIDNAFIRMVDTRLTAMGRTSGGSTTNADDTTAYISVADNLANYAKFTRHGTSDDTRISWEIIEYIGKPGGRNEIKVRQAGNVTFGASDTEVLSSIISGVTDDNAILVFITGQGNPDTGNTDYNTGIAISAWSSTTQQANFTRGEASGDEVDVSFAVVEFTGSNWADIQRIEHQYSSAGTIEVETPLNTINDKSKTFIHSQHMSGVGLQRINEQGGKMWLRNTNEVAFELESGSRDPSEQFGVVWIVENLQSSGRPMKVQHINGTRSGSGSEEFIENIPLSGSLSAVLSTSSSSIMGESARTSGTGTSFPRGNIVFQLTDGDNVELRTSDSGNTQNYHFNVVEWPFDKGITTKLFENISLIDTTQTSQTKVLTETITLEDNAGSSIKKTLIEILVFNDFVDAFATTKVITDSITIDDVIRLTITKSLSENLSLDDEIQTASITSPQESIFISDIIRLSIIKSLQETISINDKLNHKSTLTLSETIVLTDASTTNTETTLMESMSLVDEVRVSVTKTLSENISLEDSLGKNLQMILFEQLGLSDEVQTVLVIIQEESLGISDKLTLSINKALSDTISLNDNLSLKTRKKLTEDLSLGATASTMPIMAPKESLTISDQISLSITKSLEESITIIDDVSLKTRKILAEELLLDDIKSTKIIATLENTVGISDKIKLSVTKSISDSLILNDQVKLKMRKTLTEILSLDDTIQTIILSSLQESLTISDDLKLLITKHLEESVGLVDEFEFDSGSPILSPIGNKIIDAGSTLAFTISATDPDVPPQVLSFSLVGAPAGVSITAITTTTAQLTWTPTTGQIGVHTFDVIVTDGFSTDSETISVTVNAVTPPPPPTGGGSSGGSGGGGGGAISGLSTGPGFGGIIGPAAPTTSGGAKFYDVKFRLGQGESISASKTGGSCVDFYQTITISSIVESASPLKRAELRFIHDGQSPDEYTAIRMKISNMTVAPSLYTITGSIPWEFMKGTPAITYWLHALNENIETSDSERYVISVNTGYSLRGNLEFDVLTVKAEDTTIKPIAYFTNNLPRSIAGAISLLVDGKVVYTSQPQVFENGQTSVELYWNIPKVEQVSEYQLKTIAEFCGTVFETNEITLNTFPQTLTEPLSETIDVKLLTSSNRNFIAQASLLYSSNSDDTSRYKVLSPTGVCVIGDADECLVRESTFGKRGNLESVTIDGQIYRVRYSGINSVLERFSITSIDPIVGTWSVLEESVDSVIPKVHADSASILKIKYKSYTNNVNTGLSKESPQDDYDAKQDTIEFGGVVSSQKPPITFFDIQVTFKDELDELINVLVHLDSNKIVKATDLKNEFLFEKPLVISAMVNKLLEFSRVELRIVNAGDSYDEYHAIKMDEIGLENDLAFKILHVSVPWELISNNSIIEFWIHLDGDKDYESNKFTIDIQSNQIHILKLSENLSISPTIP